MTRDEALAVASGFLGSSASDCQLDQNAAYFGAPPRVYGLRSGSCWVVPLNHPLLRTGWAAVLRYWFGLQPQKCSRLPAGSNGEPAVPNRPKPRGHRSGLIQVPLSPSRPLPSPSRSLPGRSRLLPNDSASCTLPSPDTSKPLYLAPKGRTGVPERFRGTSKLLDLVSSPLSGHFQTSGPRIPSPSSIVPNHFREHPIHSSSYPLPRATTPEPLPTTPNHFCSVPNDLSMLPGSSRYRKSTWLLAPVSPNDAHLSPVRTLSVCTSLVRGSTCSRSRSINSIALSGFSLRVVRISPKSTMA